MVAVCPREKTEMESIQHRTLARHLVDEAFTIVARDIPRTWGAPHHLTIQVPRRQLLTVADEMRSYFHHIGISTGKSVLAFEYDKDSRGEPIYSRLHLHCLIYTLDNINELVAKAQIGLCKGLYKITRGWDLQGLGEYLGKQVHEVRDLPPLQILTYDIPSVESVQPEPPTEIIQSHKPATVPEPESKETTSIEFRIPEGENQQPPKGEKPASTKPGWWGKVRHYKTILFRAVRSWFRFARDR